MSRRPVASRSARNGRPAQRSRPAAGLPTPRGTMTLPMAHVVVRFARNAGIVALFIVAAMLGALSGVMFAYAGDLPQVSALDNYNPSTITRIYAANRQLIGEFATERRRLAGHHGIT